MILRFNAPRITLTEIKRSDADGRNEYTRSKKHRGKANTETPIPNNEQREPAFKGGRKPTSLARRDS